MRIFFLSFSEYRKQNDQAQNMFEWIMQSYKLKICIILDKLLLKIKILNNQMKNSMHEIRKW